MANVQVIQRHAHLAADIRLEYVNGREGKVAKVLLVAISNTRRGSGDAREEEATAIQWTVWGKQAENAADYLGKGSHVNVVGRLRNNYYEKDGEQIFGFEFTVEEIDYLDSREVSEARRQRGSDKGAPPANAGESTASSANRNRKPSAQRPTART